MPGRQKISSKAHQVERMFLVDIMPQLNALGRTRSFSCDRGEVFWGDFLDTVAAFPELIDV